MNTDDEDTDDYILDTKFYVNRPKFTTFRKNTPTGINSSKIQTIKAPVEKLTVKNSSAANENDYANRNNQGHMPINRNITMHSHKMGNAGLSIKMPGLGDITGMRAKLTRNKTAVPSSTKLHPTTNPITNSSPFSQEKNINIDDDKSVPVTTHPKWTSQHTAPTKPIHSVESKTPQTKESTFRTDAPLKNTPTYSTKDNTSSRPTQTTKLHPVAPSVKPTTTTTTKNILNDNKNVPKTSEYVPTSTTYNSDNKFSNNKPTNTVAANTHAASKLPATVTNYFKPPIEAKVTDNAKGSPITNLPNKIGDISKNEYQTKYESNNKLTYNHPNVNRATPTTVTACTNLVPTGKTTGKFPSTIINKSDQPVSEKIAKNIQFFEKTSTIIAEDRKRTTSRYGKNEQFRRSRKHSFDNILSSREKIDITSRYSPRHLSPYRVGATSRIYQSPNLPSSSKNYRPNSIQVDTLASHRSERILQSMTVFEEYEKANTTDSIRGTGKTTYSGKPRSIIPVAPISVRSIATIYSQNTSDNKNLMPTADNLHTEHTRAPTTGRRNVNALIQNFDRRS